MRSPFPGMDPYLEDPAIWPNVHSRLVNVSSELLTRDLQPRYFVGIEERVYVTTDDDPGREVIVPDLYVRPESADHAPRAASATVVKPIDVTLLDPEVHEIRAEIVDVRTRELVTVIEFLSPSNKVPNSEGRRSYLEKRTQVYQSSAHWIEVDLLRSGLTTFPRWSGIHSEYGVHLSRRIDPTHRRSLVWPIRLPQQLPKIPIPLKPGDADAELDLQEVLNLVYDRGGFASTLNYTDRPRVPLSDDWIQWSREMIARRGKVDPSC